MSNIIQFPSKKKENILFLDELKELQSLSPFMAEELRRLGEEYLKKLTEEKNE